MSKDKTKSIADSIRELTDKTAGKIKAGQDKDLQAFYKGPAKKTEKLKKVEKPVRGKNGGARPGSGRKTKEETLLRRGLKDLIDQHGNEEIEVKITDPKTGQSRIVKKPRVLIMLDTLFNIAYGEKSVAAIKEWMDRQVGKSPQPIRGDGADDTPIKLEVDISKILEKAYGNEDEREDPKGH